MVVSVGLNPGAILSGFAQAQSQNQANQIAWQNLFEQRRVNRKREELERADRSNVYGDILRYIPGQGFIHDLTPMSERIIGAQRREELQQLTEDAGRNRQIARDKSKRAGLAHEDYLREYNRYRYRPQESEGVYRAEALQDILNSRQRANSEAASMMARILMRTGGNKEAVENIYRKASENYANSFQDALLSAKRLGRAEFRAAQDYNDSKARRDLEYLRTVANDVNPTAVRPSNIAATETARGERALDDLSQAILQGQQVSQRAYQTALNTFGRSPNFGGAGSVSFRGGSGGGQAQGTTGTRTPVGTQTYYPPIRTDFDRTINTGIRGNRGEFF